MVIGQFGLVQHISLSSFFFSAAQCKFLTNTCLVPIHLSLWKFGHCKMVHVWSIALDHQSLKFCAHLYAKLLTSAWVRGRDKQVRAGKAGKFLFFLTQKHNFQMLWAHLITNSPEMWLEKMPRAWVSSTHFRSNPLLLEKNWYFSYFTMFTNWTQLLTSNDCFSQLMLIY